MPDIVVVGGGIIGAACAFELADRGASVTLLEKDELAAGASGRNLGYLDTSKDPVLAPLARRSLERYAEISADPPTPFFLDDEPIGTLAVTIDEDEIDDLRAWAASAEAVGVEVERVDERVRELEPELSPDVREAYLLHEGHRVDPLALTVCLGALARNAGATIRHHAPARRLVARGRPRHRGRDRRRRPRRRRGRPRRRTVVAGDREAARRLAPDRLGARVAGARGARTPAVPPLDPERGAPSAGRPGPRAGERARCAQVVDARVR